ncbi:bifunctional metallophosphatase/5'-nucleotidase [Azospirillum sp.]|uniref:bifunctional metallophosphatase/5'-nucleotidase n=1 Tax=Azospirillum sp. TaxID=34012 RepID=UPI002D3F3238|nr:5'-nucleotidase C-terminal domain-containing protein [Azospirillum sp.]HYD65258.1 5'-nucleotidase C-terminal domain-containing protein [Azospirillum sp.]
MPHTLRTLACALFAVLLLPLAARAQNGTLTFLHVNDVYEITPVQGRGGFAELMTLLRQERARNPAAVTTLGGDFLSPSLLSGLTKGAHMVALFNALGIEATAFGNHEFDFGPEVARQRLSESRFLWLGTNVLGPDGQPFGGAVATWTKTVGDVKVGFFGVLTPETGTLSHPGVVQFTPVLPAAAEAVKRLRADGAHVVVALTHLSMDEDRELARAVKGIDLILGGHDHDPISFHDGGTLILKAGYDAHYLGVVDLTVRTTTGDKGPVTRVEPAQWRFAATAGATPDPELAALVKIHTDALAADMDAVIGRTETELDSRRGTVRAREATMGNLVADALREALKADVAITNGGGLRADALHPAGAPIRRRDIFAEMPFGNVGVLTELKGADLLAALENGFSKVEERAGRYPQVSGLSAVYDPKAPPGARVVEVTVGGKPLDPAATYRVATNDYMLKGGDGYAALTRGRVLVDPSGAMLFATIVMDHVQARGTVSPKVEGRTVAKP